jgi:hypothetical protein
MVSHGGVDVITGDWLSEMNIAWNAIKKANHPDLGYEEGFYSQLTECIDEIAKKSIKVVTNAGALNAPALSLKVEELCKSRNVNLKVATVIGDDVTDLVIQTSKSCALKPSGLGFTHLDHPTQHLEDWNPDLKPTCAAAYIGCWGIVAALQSGADIVICGRVTDASPVIGASAWWYNWSRSDYSQLAGALVAGHLIECGSYACGANYSGFKEHLNKLVDIAFPIAEVLPDGACYISKPADMNGVVNRYNITAQLLYELQGHLYLNPDVVADLSVVQIEESGHPDRVFVHGAIGRPPPATTKVMIAAHGGYQAETTYYLNGLDVHAKAEMIRNQLANVFSCNNFCKFSVELYGREAENPSSQQEGTLMLRIFVQARRKEDVSAEKFKQPIYSLRMQSYPGYHMNLDFRTMEPKPFMEIFPSLMPQAAIKHQVVLSNKATLQINPPCETQEYPRERPSYENPDPSALWTYRDTVWAPLGTVVHARSGDKADNVSVGFFVRHADEYPWLQALLTTIELRRLLGNDYKQQRIERVLFPKIWAVHL